MVLVLLLHGLAMVQAGAVRGLGLLELATWMVLFSFYFIALPGAYIFSFPMNMGMVGLWWGVVAGAITEIVLYVIILRFVCDWRKLAVKISEELRVKTISPNISINNTSPNKAWGGLREPFLPHDLKYSVNRTNDHREN